MTGEFQEGTNFVLKPIGAPKVRIYLTEVTANYSVHIIRDSYQKFGFNRELKGTIENGMANIASPSFGR